MTRTMAGLVISVVAQVVAGCGVQLDLSNLQFKPEPAEVGSTADGGKDFKADLVVDLPGQETDLAVVPETLPEVVGPTAGCFDLYKCVLVERADLQLQDKSFNQCSADLGIDWKKMGPALELKACLQNCVVSFTAEELNSCLAAKCQGQMLSCLNDSDGEKSCGEAAHCLAVDCSKPGDDETFCSMGCLFGLDYLELPKLKAVMGECSGEALTVGCLQAIYDCYSGSGDESCLEVLDCVGKCEQQCRLPSPDECNKDVCVNECLMGMSAGAGELLAGIVPCSYDPGANLFSCVKSALTCFYDKLAGPGGDSCQIVLKKLHPLYQDAAMGTEERFKKIVAVILVAQKAQFDKLIGALNCLEGAWSATPGYGAIPEAVWNGCVGKCL